MSDISDERREVAERLRNEGRALTAIDMGVELASLTLDDAIGIEHNATWEECFDRLADLIDPTCEAAYDNPFASDFNYRCMACGEHFSTCGEPRYCPGCGRRIEHVK